MISVIGYDGLALSAHAAERLAGASLVVGAQRLLDELPIPGAATTIAFDRMADVLAGLASHNGDAVVLASGDPGFFGIVRALRAEGLAVLVFPALSSVCVLFARAAIPWDDAVVVSAHGRDGRELRTAINVSRTHHKVAILCGPGATPRDIGTALHGTARTLIVGEQLGYSDERVTHCTPTEAADREWDALALVIVLDDKRAIAETKQAIAGWRSPAGWALPESEFEHRDGQITKTEVRALVLARLGPRLGDLIWDIGSGSGSVAIECARLGAGVIAIDKDAEQIQRLRSNAARHGVDVQTIEGAAPEALAGLPEPDAVFIGGSGPGFAEVLTAAAQAARRTVVLALAGVERVVPAQRALTEAGFAVETVLLQASRLTGVGDLHRLAAQNPVFVVSGVRQ